MKTFMKVLATILCVVMVLCSAPLAGFVGLELRDFGGLFVANALVSPSPYSGKCGENLYWELDSYKYYPNNSYDCKVYISGTGEMANFDTLKNDPPWDHEFNHIVAVIIEDGATSIGDYAFFNYYNITSVTIPDSVTSIGDSAFYRCSLLMNLKLPKELKNIGSDAFDACTYLSKISYPGNFVNWCEIEFGNPNANPLSLAHNFYVNGVSISGDLVIPNTVTSINDYAFFNYRGITSVEISESTEYMGKAVFGGCSNLSKFIVDSENPVYSSDEDGVLFDKNKTELLQYPANSTKTNYSIPDSVTSIGDYAFNDCKKLTSITIPDGVTSIGDYAFADCTNLTSVIIPDSVTSIGKNAFGNCSALTSVTLGDGLKSIGDSAFIYCDALSDISIGNNLESIGDYAFRYCESLSSIKTPDSVTSIGDGVFR